MPDDTTKRPEDALISERTAPTPRVPSGGAPDVAEPPQENLTEPPALVGSALTKTLSSAFYEAEETETKLYKVPIMNATFALMSALLLFVTVWAVWQDYDREWKHYNYEWQDFQAQQLEAQIALERAVIQEERDRLVADIAQTEKRLNNPSMRLKRTLVNNARSASKIADTKAKFFKAKLDSVKFFHEKEVEGVLHHHGGRTDDAAKEIEVLEDTFHDNWTAPYEVLLATAQIKEQEFETAEASLTKRKTVLNDLKEKRDKTVKAVELLKANLSTVDASAKNTIRNWPLLDFFSPSAKIEKVVLNDLTEPLNFLDVPRVDRCKSCHINIDSPEIVDAKIEGMEDRAHGGRVFESHPRLDLFVGSASPHPYLEFGCTICHYGDPRALSFTTASHTPADDHEAHEWEKDYHWHKMHHQDYPMLPMEHLTATCSKCHTEETRIQGADKWNEGRHLVERYGCFGCHKLKGFEDYDKVGPNLSRIVSKVKPDFLYKWIRNPTSFRPTTLMPRFFDLDNNQGDIEVIGEGGASHVHGFQVRNGVEALSIAHYLKQNSGKLDNLWALPENLSGDVTRGQQVFSESGCGGCHSIANLGITANDFAPDLGGVGSKLNEDWLYDWVVQPEHYDPASPMPKLRLEKDENGEQKVADLVTFLMSLKNEPFEQIGTVAIASDDDRQILRDLAYTNLRQTRSRREVDALIAAAYAPAPEPVTPPEREEKKPPILTPGGGDNTLLDYVGERMIARYGCFGCHEGIKGFENAQPIGTELSKHGNKGVDRLDYGHWGHQPNEEYAVGKTRIAWFTQKLENTRIFDMIPKHGKNKDGHSKYEATETRMTKAPEDLLKMPLFAFHDDPEKVAAAVTFLISNVTDPIPMQKKHILDAKEKAIEKGTRITRDFNCKGCHRIGAEVQEHNLADLPRFSFEDPEEAAERNELEKETWLAEEIVLEAIPGKQLNAITLQKGTFLSQTFRWTGSRGPDDEYSVIEILQHYWETKGVPERDRIVPLFGHNEGRVRLLFGKSAEDRPKAPPLLRLEGLRVHGEWLFNFLLDVQPLRPWLNIRMPSYNMTTDESSAIVDMFRALSDEEGSYEHFPSHKLDIAAAQAAQYGKERFAAASSGGLGCNSCHPAGDQMPASDDKNSWGPNLDLARDRLRPAWIYSWLTSPNSFMPGTKMPAFWIQADPFVEEEAFSPEDRALIDSYVPFLEGVGLIESQKGFKKDMNALVQFLMHMDQVSE